MIRPHAHDLGGSLYLVFQIYFQSNDVLEGVEPVLDLVFEGGFERERLDSIGYIGSIC